MINSKRSLVLGFLVLIGFSISAQTILVSDYGAKPNSFEDATESVKSAIEACKESSATHLLFEKGRYDFWPMDAEKRELYISNTSSESECMDKTKNIGLLFEGMEGLTIDGQGATFVFHGKMTTWSFIDSQNMELKNIIVDFERPTMSELTLLDIQPHSITTQIHPDSRYAILDGKIHWYGEGWEIGTRQHTIVADTVNGLYKYSSSASLNEAKAIEMGNSIVKFEGDFTNPLKYEFRNGVTLSIRNPIRDQVGAFVYRSKNIKLNNVVMHYMHGIGITSQFSENLTYNKVQVTPSRGRSTAAFADGMQFSGCKGEIKVTNCSFKGLHDDPINIHGTYLQIAEIISPTELIVEFKHHQTYGFNAFYPGDSISFVTKNAIQSKGITTLKSAELISKKQMRLELVDALPRGIAIQDCVENLTWTPSVEIRNCRFEGTNTRGVLVTTPRKVVIDSNHFYRLGMYSILIASDVNSWFESGAVTDVTICNNTFEDCGHNLGQGAYAIALLPENREVVSNHWVHRNVNIIGNLFKASIPQALIARSTDGVQFKDNILEYSNFGEVNSSIERPLFNLMNCTKVVFKNNSYKLKDEDKIIQTSHMRKKDIRTDL